MNQQWQSLISQHSNNSSEDSAISDTALFNLSEYITLLEFSGEDAKTYLQGQLTNDINDVNEERSQLSGYCNPKGRLLALFRVFLIKDKIYLQLPKELAEKILKRMQMFVMMSKVTIKDVSDELINIGIAGKELTDKLPPQVTALSNRNNSLTSHQGVTFINVSNNETPRFQCIASSKLLLPFISQLISKKVRFNDINGWIQLNIQSGMPCVVKKTIEAFVPQMLNLHLLKAINFKKGCYTGQEVVARMHYLGKLKRLMYQLKFSSDKAPLAGDSLYSPESTSAQGAGKIVLASSITDKEVIALAVVEISIIEKDAIYLDQDCTIKAKVIQLPYSLKAE